MIAPKIKNEKNKMAFLDMDGFLAIYERDAYKTECGITPGLCLYQDEKAHYFRTCKRDDAAYALAQDIMRQFETYILTTIPPETPWSEVDKDLWLNDKVPEVDTATQLIIADSDKAETIMVLQQLETLTENMILIDDYNPNLHTWREAGGTAIKYLNGLNSKESWDGPTITREEAVVPGIINIKIMEAHLQHT